MTSWEYENTQKLMTNREQVLEHDMIWSGKKAQQIKST